MEHYATLKNQEVIGIQSVANTSLAPAGGVHLSAWDGVMPARPSEFHGLRVVNGALSWVIQVSHEQAWVTIRSRREALLRTSDWRPIQAADRGGVDATAWLSSPWRAYRQALRDITNQPDPFNLVWPVEPND